MSKKIFIVIIISMRITIPNIITSIRLAAIPVMAYYIYASVFISEDYNIVAFILFISIWTTDVLDGFIARKFNQISDFGKLFDPFVDKLFHFVTALMMWLVGKIPVWVPILIFLKELLMIIGGTVLFKKYRMVVYSKWYGKLATVLFVLAFCILFFIPNSDSVTAGYLFIIPIVISFYAYIKYGFDNVIPVIYRRSKRKLDSDTIASEQTNYRVVLINKKDKSKMKKCVCWKKFHKSNNKSFKIIKQEKFRKKQ